MEKKIEEEMKLDRDHWFFKFGCVYNIGLDKIINKVNAQRNKFEIRRNKYLKQEDLWKYLTLFKNNYIYWDCDGNNCLKSNLSNIEIRFENVVKYNGTIVLFVECDQSFSVTSLNLKIWSENNYKDLCYINTII